ncbi:AT-rich interactive domain-containing protein 1A-like [Orcinus orca]|uniref:AT-rich interactive domain-containing protein 1A-like n=1 Tax=Orcinus orca TaxID=9733 RepID=UPI002111B9B3|nr:AT-rich interactive domain-containing protein 1A-like [Orcinus orca]XP_049556803.1 AT-rich interactive domain-containing protein 1A-like [Orcinus orca]XP_049556804.1 AT-rich interactive domain-containing protein 1A-like [Orcinus orca]XP_049556805.1 AT-rich interactive domain-containing protein 1A-like [Orcinus orca]XP_049556806.1 AT-rich interactive domain-containing protein 1A-like [Orcinus orca]XP_049556807.1 AT-rich interactive domain-containing protein 1A-like [Orcinus orca]XP_04955680
MYQRVCLLGPRFPEQLSPVSTVLSHLPRVSREGNYFAHVLNCCGGVSCRRGWSLFLRVRWLEDAPERRGCGGGGGGGRIGNGARVERRRRRRRRRAGPNGVNSPGGGGGGGQDPEGEAAAEPGSRLRWKPGLSAAEGFCGGRERTS